MNQRKQIFRTAAAAAVLAAVVSFSVAAQGAEEYQDFTGQGPMSGNAVTETAPNANGSQPVQVPAADDEAVWEEITVEGAIDADGDSFPSITQNGTTYLLHANYRYVAALGLEVEDGEYVTAEGFVMPYAADRLGLEEDQEVLRVTKAVVDGETYELGMNTAYGMNGRRGAVSPESMGRPSAGGMMYGGKTPMGYGNSYGDDDRFDGRSDDGGRFDRSGRFSQHMGRNDQRFNSYNGNNGYTGRSGAMGEYCPYYDTDDDSSGGFRNHDGRKYQSYQNNDDSRGGFSDRNSRGGRW